VASAASAWRDPRYLGVTSLTTAAVVSFVEFVDESSAFRAIFALVLATAFAAVNLATIAVVLPMSEVSPDDAARSRTVLVWASAILLLTSTVVAALI
jgi:hypothetical protein